jgi:hypothetical protein
LTGYDRDGLQRQIETGVDFETFLARAPAPNPQGALITGTVCGVRIEEVDPPARQAGR